MKRIDEYLSNKAQQVWPAALVWRDSGTGVFFLERPEETVQLGIRLAASRRALYRLMDTELERRKAGGSGPAGGGAQSANARGGGE